MKKYFIYFATFVMLCGCNKLPNKPIYEELSINELEMAIKADSAFGEFYDMAVKEDIFSQFSPSQKAKYRKATWKRVYKYMKYREDYCMWFKKDSIWTKQWEKEYAADIARADSIISYWRQYRDSCLNVCSNYATIEPKDTRYERYEDYEWNYYGSHYVTKYRLIMDFAIHLKNGIEKIDEIVYKMEWFRTDYSKEYSSTTSVTEYNITSTNNIVTYKCYGEPKDRVKNVYIDKIIMSTDTIISNYNKDSIPRKVFNYIINEESVARYNDVIKEYASADYIDNWSYNSMQKEMDLKKYDELVYNLINEMR